VKHWLGLSLVAAALISFPASAQAPAPSPAAAAPSDDEAPPDENTGEADDNGAPGPVDENAPLPPGHPPVTGGGNAAGMPNVPQDHVTVAPQLPAGSVEVSVVDADGKPLGNMPVKLGIVRQSVAEGEEREHKLVVSNAEGKSRFDGLQTGSKYNYRATVDYQGASYASQSFSMRVDFGMNVLVHVFPVTADINQTRIAGQGIVVVSPRDDTFQFEVLYRFFNVSKTTWVPSNVVLDMPPGFKAFTAEDSMDDTRVVQDGPQSLRLTGTFSPGQHEMTFRFQVPNDHDPSVSFRMALPPHMGEIRVLAEAARGMSMQVDGFSPPQLTTGEGGQRLLVTERRMRQGDAALDELAINLSGIPTPGPGRWYAVVIALLLAAGGFSFVFQERKEKGDRPSVDRKDALRARDLLLQELVALEKARRAEEVGPRTYETARRALVDALARLEAQLPKPAPKGAKRRRPARA